MNEQPLPTATKQAKRQYYPALDGLRGLAILLVVVYHNFGFIDVFFFGWLGVDLFFVLSGFLITDILLKTVADKNYFRNFYMRRILRIFPLYYISLIIFLFVLPALFTDFDVTYYKEHQTWLWTYLQNWLYIFQNPGNSNALNHLWSLAVEEQFYFLWPIVILVIRKPRPLLIFISLLLAFVVGLRLWIWLNQVQELAYFNLYTFTRIDGVCIGCMIALLQRIQPKFLQKNTTFIVLIFAMLNFLFFFINRSYGFGFPYLALAGYTTFAMLFGLLVNEAVMNKNGWTSKVFDLGILKFFGRISYGFYIFHWPIYLILTPFLYPFIENLTGKTLLDFSVSIIATVAAILLSWLSFRYFESVFLRQKKHFN